MHEAGLGRPCPVFTLPAWGRAEYPYISGDLWSLSYYGFCQHTCNFPAMVPSCLELWVMCFKSWSGMKWLWAASVVWTRPLQLVQFPWRRGVRARKRARGCWESVRRQSQASGWSREIWEAKSALSSLKGMLRGQYELSSIGSTCDITSITTENTSDFLNVLFWNYD